LAALSLGAFLGFLGLAAAVRAGATDRTDVALLLWIHGLFPAWLDGPMVAVTALGYYSVVAVLAVVAALLFYARGRGPYALFVTLSAFGGMVLATVAKDAVGRVRPRLFHFADYPVPSSHSFPSGHATMAVAFYGVLGLLVALELGGRRSRWGALAAGAILALLIGFSRNYLGVHYPSDVLGGYLLGASWAAAAGAGFTRWRSGRSRSKAPRAGERG
jgi:undecaprenyl-diphosphatase